MDVAVCSHGRGPVPKTVGLPQPVPNALGRWLEPPRQVLRYGRWLLGIVDAPFRLKHEASTKPGQLQALAVPWAPAYGTVILADKFVAQTGGLSLLSSEVQSSAGHPPAVVPGPLQAVGRGIGGFDRPILVARTPWPELVLGAILDGLRLSTLTSEHGFGDGWKPTSSAIAGAAAGCPSGVTSPRGGRAAGRACPWSFASSSSGPGILIRSYARTLQIEHRALPAGSKIINLQSTCNASVANAVTSKRVGQQTQRTTRPLGAGSDPTVPPSS